MEMSKEPTLHIMSDDEYHADPCPKPSLSSGVARTLHELSPAHAWTKHPRLGRQVTVPSKQMLFGSAVHKLVLQPEDLQPVTLVEGPDGPYTNWRSKDAQAQRDIASSNGHIPMLTHEYEAACELADAIKASQLFEDKTLFALGADAIHEYAEAAITWTEGDVWFRIKPDYFVVTVQDVVIIDLKTTGVAATPDNWGRTMIWNYAMQSGLYRRGLQKLYPEHDIHWKFVVAETDPPYGIAAFQFDEQGTQYADQICEKAVATWKRCLANDKWPCYSTDGCFEIETPFYIREKMT